MMQVEKSSRACEIKQSAASFTESGAKKENYIIVIK